MDQKNLTTKVNKETKILNNINNRNDIIVQMYDVWPPLMGSEKAEQEMTRIGSSAAFHNTIGPFSEHFFYKKKNTEHP